MAVETATYISQLDVTKPSGSDPKAEGDDHVRLLKSTTKNTFPNFTAAPLNATQAQIDKLVTSIVPSTSAPANAISVSASGNVGIGITSPAYKLDVGGTIAVQTATGIETAVRLFQSGVSNWKMSIPANTAALVITDTGAGVDRVKIDDVGCVIQSAPASPPTLTLNNTLVMNMTSNTNLRISARGSDGVTRTANITLA